jgi:diguanylate cyclase (GGDEF)-like protein
MKIGEGPRPAKGPTAARRAEGVARYAANQQAASSAPAADAASVMGVPEAELTPKVRDAIMTLMAEVQSLRRELEQAQARLNQLEELADQDTLAPVYNRRAFVRELNRVISFSQRYNVPSSLIYFDVNGFKKINDEHGHPAGDAALLHVALTLLANLRESDTVARLGGDEFGVVLAHADSEQAAAKARQLAEKIAGRPVEHESRTFQVTVAYGAATFRSGEDAEATLAEADRAMYEHKAKLKAAGGAGRT